MKNLIRGNHIIEDLEIYVELNPNAHIAYHKSRPISNHLKQSASKKLQKTVYWITSNGQRSVKMKFRISGKNIGIKENSERVSLT